MKYFCHVNCKRHNMTYDIIGPVINEKIIEIFKLPISYSFKEWDISKRYANWQMQAYKFARCSYHEGQLDINR